MAGRASEHSTFAVVRRCLLMSQHAASVIALLGSSSGKRHAAVAATAFRASVQACAGFMPGRLTLSLREQAFWVLEGCVLGVL